MSLFQWEHQLFCYDWLFYKCFLVSFSRNVITRSGYWLLITQLNCLYCTTQFLALTWPESFDIRVGFSSLWIVFFFFCFQKKNQLQLLTHSAAASRHIICNKCKYQILWIIVYYCINIGRLCKSSPCKIEIHILSCLCLWFSCTWAPKLLSVSEAPVNSEINVSCEHLW